MLSFPIYLVPFFHATECSGITDLQLDLGLSGSSQRKPAGRMSTSASKCSRTKGEFAPQIRSKPVKMDTELLQRREPAGLLEWRYPGEQAANGRKSRILDGLHMRAFRGRIRGGIS